MVSVTAYFAEAGMKTAEPSLWGCGEEGGAAKQATAWTVTNVGCCSQEARRLVPRNCIAVAVAHAGGLSSIHMPQSHRYSGDFTVNPSGDLYDEFGL